MCWRMLARAARIAAESGEPPPSSAVICGLNTRSRTRCRVTSLSILTRYQSHSRRLSARSIGSSASSRRSRFSTPRVSSRYSAMTIAPDNECVALGQQHRQRAGRVERQEFLAPRPWLFLDQRQLAAIFAKGEADETGGSGHRMVK